MLTWPSGHGMQATQWRSAPRFGGRRGPPVATLGCTQGSLRMPSVAPSAAGSRGDAAFPVRPTGLKH